MVVVWEGGRDGWVETTAPKVVNNGRGGKEETGLGNGQEVKGPWNKKRGGDMYAASKASGSLPFWE